MLGDQIGEERGKITSLRVLASEGGPKVEVSMRTEGKILGQASVGRGSYWSAVQPGGYLYGEGQGIIMTASGDMATWTGSGTGQMKPGGGASYRGAVYYRSATGQLARLAGMAVVFEHESDANDNVTSKLWEWK
jgi:hypothetical protein